MAKALCYWFQKSLLEIGWSKLHWLCLSNALKAFRAACRYCIDLTHVILADYKWFCIWSRRFWVFPPSFWVDPNPFLQVEAWFWLAACQDEVGTSILRKRKCWWGLQQCFPWAKINNWIWKGGGKKSLLKIRRIWNVFWGFLNFVMQKRNNNL